MVEPAELPSPEAAQEDLGSIAFYQTMGLWRTLYCLDHQDWDRLWRDLREPANAHSTFRETAEGAFSQLLLVIEGVLADPQRPLSFGPLSEDRSDSARGVEGHTRREPGVADRL